MAEIKNKRVAKNTLFLYFRMILIMLVTLYTSRLYWVSWESRTMVSIMSLVES